MGCDNGKKGASQVSSKAKKSDIKVTVPQKLANKKESAHDIVLENDKSKLTNSNTSKSTIEVSLKDEKKKKNRKKSKSKEESKKLTKDSSFNPAPREVIDDMGQDEPLYLNYDNIKTSSDGQFNVDDKEDINAKDDKNNTFINVDSNNGVIDDNSDAIYDNDDIIQRHLRSDLQQTTTSANNKHMNRPQPQTRSSCRQASTRKSKQDDVLTQLGNKSLKSGLQENEQNVSTRIEGANNNSQINTSNDNHASKKKIDKDKNTRADIRQSRSEKKQQSSKTDKSTKKPNSVLAVLESISKQSSANDKSCTDDIYDQKAVQTDIKQTADEQIYCNTIEVSEVSQSNAIISHDETQTSGIVERSAVIENEDKTIKPIENQRIQQQETMNQLSPSRHHVNTVDIENNPIVGHPQDPLVNVNQQSTEELSELSRISCTLKKGTLWQQQNHNKFHERIFNRWKERYFILTNDYLACFKKSTKVGHSEMGGFLYKAALVDVTNLKWADKKKDGVICLHISGSFSLLLWTNQGLDEWMYLIKDAVDGSKGRREILIRKTRTLSSTTTSSPSIANNCTKNQSSAQEYNNIYDNSYSQSNPGTTTKSNPALQDYSSSKYVLEQPKKPGIVSHKSTNALPTDSCSHRNNNNTIETKSPSKVYNSESMLLDNADTTSEATRKDYSSPEKRKDHDWKRDALVSQRPTPNAIVKPSAGDSESTATTSANDVQRLNQFQPFDANKRHQSLDEEGGSSKKSTSSNQQGRATPSTLESSSASSIRSKQQAAHSSGSKTSSIGLIEESPSHKNNDLQPLISPLLRRQPTNASVRHNNGFKERSASQEATTSSYNCNISSGVQQELQPRNGANVSAIVTNKHQQQPNSRASPQMNRLKSLQHHEGPLMLRTINQTGTDEDHQAIKYDSSSPPTSNVLPDKQQHLSASSYQSHDVQPTKMPLTRDSNNFQPLVKRDDSWQSLLSLSHINRPTPKSLQVSPALAERSLYAQHLMDSAESTRTSGYNTASSSKGMLRLLQSVKSKQKTSNEHCDVSNNQQSMQQQSSSTNGNNNTKANILLHHQNTLSRFIDTNAAIYTLSNQNMLVSSNSNPYGDYSSARSALKSATSEFSFIRPNSPMLSTLPHSSRSMQFKQQLQQQQQQQQQDHEQEQQQYHETIPEQHILTADGQHKTTILTNENLGVRSSGMDQQQALVSLPPMTMLDVNLATNESNIGDFLAPPSRELPMKPNQKRASKKSMQKSSSLSSSIANFFGRAFTRSRSSSRKQSRNKTGTTLHNKDNIVVGIFDETNLSYAPIIAQQNNISNPDSDKSICQISNHQQSPPFQQQQKQQYLQQQPQKMVDMIKAFTDQTMPNGQDDLCEQEQLHQEVHQQIQTHQNPPTLMANLEKHRSHYSRPQAIAEFAASVHNQNSPIVNPAISNNNSNRILMSPMHKSNSVIAGSGGNLTQIDLINGLLDHRSSYNPININGGDQHPQINAANGNFPPRSSYDRSPVSFIRRHPTVCSPSRPSSIYGQPSLVSQPGSLIDRPFFGNHRNSLHHVRDGTGNLVMMMPSLDTTREVAENIASPTSPIKSPLKQANSNNNIKISNHGHYDHGSNHHLDHNRRSSQIDPTNCAVVSPFHQSPTLNNIYDNHPGLMRPPDNFLYDNQASLYISSKVSDSMPSHLFMAANSNNSNNNINNNNSSNNNFNSNQMHIDGDPYRRTSHYLPGSVNLPGTRQSSASIHEANLHRNSQSNITANMIKPSAIVTPNSPKSHYQHLNDYQIPSNNAPIRSSLEHQIYKPSTSRSMSPGVISPLVGRRNSNYQQSPLVTRSTRASDHVSISPSINLVGAPGVKLDPNLAASLLVTPNGLRTDLIDNTMIRNQNMHLGGSHNVSDGNDSRNKTFLVSTRLTKSLASANNHVSTPTRYLPQQKQPGSSTDRFFATEAVNATPIKSQSINQGLRNNACLIQNGQSTKILAASTSSSSSSSSNRQRNCSSTETSSSETSGSLSNGSRVSSSDDHHQQQRSVNKKSTRLNANVRNKITNTSNDLADEISSQNIGTDSSSAASSTRYSSNTRSGSARSDALSASDSLDDRAWVTSKLVESHLETNDDDSKHCLKLSGCTNKRCTSLTQSEKDLLEGAIS